MRESGGTPRVPRWKRRRRLARETAPEPRRSTVIRHLGADQAGRLWERLSTLDFIGHSFSLAALAMMCFFPFLIVVTAAAGEDAAQVLAHWLGLNEQAAQAVTSLFSPAENMGTFTVTSALLMIFGAEATAAVLQSWYQEVFDVSGRTWRDLTAQLYWLASLLAYCAVQTLLGKAFGGAPGGALLPILSGFAVATLFWWWSLYVLLRGAVPWRSSFPAAVATGACWTGLGVFSAHFFSSTIIANEQKYGPIGVVIVILSWLVAVGVVIHLGAVVGRLYGERHPPPAETHR
ncbi:YhjD/YihY/BrkB family envelope integrity protein [Streptomyces sp. NPDC003362]